MLQQKMAWLFLKCDFFDMNETKWIFFYFLNWKNLVEIQKKITWFNWSTGKDSALALYKLRQNPEFKITGLITSVNLDYDRVSIHGVRKKLLERQACELGLPLHIAELPNQCTNEIYKEKMFHVIENALQNHVTYLGFGDIFLEDIRKYREDSIRGLKMSLVFPLWKLNTLSIANELINLPIKSVITCVDLNKMPISFLGREFNNDFLKELPANIDPCGENGEFHTFVYSHPLFQNEIKSTVTYRHFV